MTESIDEVRRDAERDGARITRLLLSPPTHPSRLIDLLRSRDRYLNEGACACNTLRRLPHSEAR